MIKQKLTKPKTVCVLGGDTGRGISADYYWNEGNGWNLGGTLLRPRAGHTTLTQGASEYLTFGGNGTYPVEKWVNEFEKSSSNTTMGKDYSE